MADKTLKFELAIGSDGLIEGLKVASAQVGAATQSMKLALGGIGSGTSEASRHLSGFTRTLHDFKAEQVQQGRTAAFFASQLAEIIPGADGAKASLAGLIGVFASGFTAQAALEALVFAAKMLKDALEKDEKQAHELHATFKEATRSALETLDAAERSLHPKSKSQSAIEQVAINARKQVADLQKQIDDLMSKSGGFFQGAKNFGMAVASTFLPVENPAAPFSGASNVGGDVAALQAQQQAVLAAAAGATKAKGGGLSSADIAKQNLEISNQIRSIRASLADDIVKIEAEKDNKISELDQRTDIDDPKKKAELRQAIEKEAAEKIVRLKEDREREYTAKLIQLTEGQGTAQQKILLDAQVRIAEIEHQYRDRKSKADQAQRDALIAAEQKNAQRQLELLEATHQKMVADSAAAARKEQDARLAEMVKGEQKIDAMLRQIRSETHGQEFAAAVDEIKAEASARVVAIRESSLTASEKLNAIAQVNANATQKMKQAWVALHSDIIQQFVTPLQQTFSALFHSFVDDTFNLADAMKNVLLGALDALIGKLVEMGVQAIAMQVAGGAVAKTLAISTTQGHIAEAVAGAAASQAFIPFVGPGLATAAAGEMLASLEGITAPLLSSAGGLDRVPRDGMLAELHKDETVLSAPFARGLRRMIGDGRSGGGGSAPIVNLHFNAPVDRSWWMANQPHILRVLADAARRDRHE